MQWQLPIPNSGRLINENEQDTNDKYKKYIYIYRSEFQSKTIRIRGNQLLLDIVVSSDSAAIVLGEVEEDMPVVHVIEIIHKY